jgi:hypothetical protein
MFDNKFIFTLIGLIVAVLAICKFNIGSTENFIARSSRVIDTRITPAPSSSCKGGCQVYYMQNATPEINFEDIANEAGALADEVEPFFQQQNVPGPSPSDKVAIATYGPDFQQTNLPVNDMTEGDQSVFYERLIFANKGHRLLGLGDPIRGDLPICPNKTGWFQVSADPKNQLQQGGANVLFGASDAGNAMNTFINGQTAGTDTTIAGTDVAGAVNISPGIPFEDIDATASPNYTTYLPSGAKRDVTWENL